MDELVEFGNSPVLLGTLDAVRSKFISAPSSSPTEPFATRILVKDGLGCLIGPDWDSPFRVIVYFGLSCLFDVDWCDSDVHLYVLYAGETSHAEVKLTLNGQSVSLSAPRLANKRSWLRNGARVWKDKKGLLKTPLNVKLEYEKYELEFKIPRGSSKRPLGLNAAVFENLTRFLQENRTPRYNPICAVRRGGWYSLVGMELLFPDTDLGNYDFIAGKVQELDDSALLNLEFALLHSQLDEIDRLFLHSIEEPPQGCLGCSVNITRGLLKALVEYDPFALRRFKQSPLSLHCSLELTESLSNPEGVENAMKLDNYALLPKIQDDIKWEGLLYALRDLVDAVIWLKLDYHHVQEMANQPHLRQTIKLICLSAKRRGQEVVFEGVESPEFFEEVLKIGEEGLYIPQTFLIQWNPSVKRLDLSFLRDGGAGLSPFLRRY